MKVFDYCDHHLPYQRVGKIIRSNGNLFEIVLPQASVGSHVLFRTKKGVMVEGEVVAIQKDKVLVMPYVELLDVGNETLVYMEKGESSVYVGESMVGRVLDFQGKPMDDGGALSGSLVPRSILGQSINPLNRPPIDAPLDVGISAINSFLTIGKGQRMAIMAGSGVGKSVLLGMVARNTTADVNVIALVGERGREVMEFIKNDLGEKGLARSVLVVATSDTSPLIRIKAAMTATTIAEYFREQGKDVLLMMDSITRFAMAQREVSLSSGEHPGQRGYSPSVFARLSRLLERSGRVNGQGSITGLYAVLVEGGDFDEPITDAVRSIADGHIILSRNLAIKNHYPAIDILQSISRVMDRVVSKEHRIVALHLRDLMASYKEVEDLINVGAYARGSNPKVDKAISVHEDMMEFLKQDIEETTTLEEVFDRIVEIARKAEKTNK